MRTLRLATNGTVNLWSDPKVTNHTDPDHPHYVSMGGFGMFVDNQTINELALALVKRMYDTDTKPDHKLLDTLAYLTHVMSTSERDYYDAAADEAYDQYLDDAITGA
jgi:hypothetical protein